MIKKIVSSVKNMEKNISKVVHKCPRMSYEIYVIVYNVKNK